MSETLPEKIKRLHEENQRKFDKVLKDDELRHLERVAYAVLSFYEFNKKKEQISKLKLKPNARPNLDNEKYQKVVDIFINAGSDDINDYKTAMKYMRFPVWGEFFNTINSLLYGKDKGYKENLVKDKFDKKKKRLSYKSIEPFLYNNTVKDATARDVISSMRNRYTAHFDFDHLFIENTNEKAIDLETHLKKICDLTNLEYLIKEFETIFQELKKCNPSLKSFEDAKKDIKKLWKDYVFPMIVFKESKKNSVIDE